MRKRTAFTALDAASAGLTAPGVVFFPNLHDKLLKLFKTRVKKTPFSGAERMSNDAELRPNGAERMLNGVFRRPFRRYPSNRLLFGNPLGGRRPASARLPIHSLSSGMATVNARPAESRQLMPSAMANTLASETPPSL